MGLPHAHIRTVHTTRRIKTKGRHTFHPKDRICVKCDTNEIENDNVLYGCGITCKDQVPFIEVPETFQYVCYCEEDHPE